MANKWITLSDSDNSVTKKFICAFPGYYPRLERKDTINTTLDGELDISRGGIYRTHSYNLRVRIEETDDQYGTQADLEYFYNLNNPNGTPSDLLTLIDHYENMWLVAMVGNYNPQAQTIYLDGPYAYAMIPIELKVISALEDSGS